MVLCLLRESWIDNIIVQDYYFFVGYTFLDVSYNIMPGAKVYNREVHGTQYLFNLILRSVLKV